MMLHAATLGYVVAILLTGGALVRGETEDSSLKAFAGPKVDLRGTPFESVETMKNVRAAAERGDPIAQANLSFAYARGLRVPLDYSESRRWARKAAEGGEATGHVGLAFLYATGRGGERSYLLAYKHYFLAAIKGTKEANYHRTRWYAREPMARNYALSLMFGLVAALQGHPRALAAALFYFGCIATVCLIVRRLFRRIFPARFAGKPESVVLSSHWTWPYKFIGSAVWLAMLICLGVLISLGALNETGILRELLGPSAWPATAISAVVAVFVGGKLWELKRVELRDGVLHVSNYVDSIAIPLRNISKVSGSLLVHPEFAWIELDRPTIFGTRIVFMPPGRFLNWGRHPVVERLRAMVAGAQGAHGEAGQ
jgi:hypothetical protein